MRSFLTTLILTAAVLMVPMARIVDADHPVADKVQKRYDSLKSFQASFTQELTNAQTGERQHRKGTIWFRQPSLLRWETAEPESELLVVGPEYVWDYFENEGLAIKYRVNQLFNSKTMIRFLSGKANLKEDFEIENQGDDHGLTKLKLVPLEPEPGLVLAYIWVDPETDFFRRILLVDFYGNGNQVDLGNPILDEPVNDSLFTFTPPADAEVQDNTK